jgi:hypothetical protein
LPFRPDPNKMAMITLGRNAGIGGAGGKKVSF